MINSGTVNPQNAVAGQLVNFAGTYNCGGAVRVDLGDRLQLGGTANLTGGSSNPAFAPNSGLAPSFVCCARRRARRNDLRDDDGQVPNATTSVTYTATT